MDMREIVGRSLLSSDLETSEIAESAIDRVAALGKCTKLGALLHHWKYASQHRFGGPCLTELARKCRRRFQIAKFHVEHPTLIRACKQALREWHAPQCTSCRGMREIVNDGKTAGGLPDATKRLRIVCMTCKGAGVRRYNDYERMDALGVSMTDYRSVWEARLTAIGQIISANDAGAAGRCRFELREKSQ